MISSLKLPCMVPPVGDLVTNETNQFARMEKHVSSQYHLRSSSTSRTSVNKNVKLGDDIHQQLRNQLPRGDPLTKGDDCSTQEEEIVLLPNPFFKELLLEYIDTKYFGNSN